jgi:Fur family ferric uptake transcriptional regulator/Fur family peroxide stress response transcriptional regulator
MNTKNKVKERLLEFGIKPSLQRMAIMEYLINHLTHPTADTIFNNLYSSIPTLSKTTVYNTLKLLEEQGAIQAIGIDDKNVHYDADISSHAHFQCKRCSYIYDIPFKNTEVIEMEHFENLTITECQVYFKGYCERCQKVIDRSVS